MCNETLVATSGTLPFPQGRTRSPVHTSLLWFVNVKQHLSKAQLSKVKSYRFTRTTYLQKVAEQDCGVKLGPANFTSIMSISPHHQNGGKKKKLFRKLVVSTVPVCVCVFIQQFITDFFALNLTGGITPKAQKTYKKKLNKKLDNHAGVEEVHFPQGHPVCHPADRWQRADGKLEGS